MGWIIAGIAAIGLPVIAHLLSRRGGRTVVFPAARFVMRAAAEHARRHRLRDLLLLLMRVGAVALIALAFDRPVWVTEAEGGGGGSAGQDVVIVLDASASMSRTVRGRALYEVARDRAVEVLEGLDWTRDRAGVVYTRATPQAALPRLSGNRRALLERLRESAVTLERGDLGGALSLAMTLPRALDVEQGSHRVRRIVVIGDRQRTQWEGVEAPVGAEAMFSAVGPGGSTGNLAVTDVRLAPERALAGREGVVTATVGNFGQGAESPRVVLREAGGRELGASTPTIGPGGRTTVSFPTVFGEEGLRRLEAALVDDSFTPDDVGRVVADVAGARRVVMVTRARAGDMGSAAYFLEAALAPDERAGCSVERARPEEIGSGVLEGVSALVVVETGRVPARGVEMLGRFVESGGGVLWVVDSDASAAGLAMLGEVVGSGVYGAPAELMEIGGGGAGLGEFRFDRLGVEEGPAGALAMGLRSVVMRSVAPMEVSVPGAVLARLEGGEAFLIDAPMGEGRVVSAHGPLDPAHSTLVKSPVFPVLVGEVVGVLSAGRSDVARAHVGEPVVVEVRGGFEGVLRDARDGSAARVMSEGGGRVRVVLEGAEAPGFVGVVDGSGEMVGSAAVGIDPRESDMRAMGDEEIAAVLSDEGLVEGGGAAALIERRKPIELWGWLMAGAVLLLGGEALVSAARGSARAPGGAGGEDG